MHLRGHCDTEGVRGSFAELKQVVVGLPVVLSATFAMVLAVVAGPLEAGSTTVATTSPVSASFLPSGEGWVLSGHLCPTGVCISVERTLNHGRSWKPLPLPSLLRTAAYGKAARYFPLIQENIYFADAKNGWIFGSRQLGGSGAQAFVTPDAEIWTTHDGGETWSALDTKSLGMKFDVISMAASRGSVYAIGWLTDQTFGLWRSSVRVDSWQRLRTPILHAAAGGSNMEGALVFKGANGWLMVGNDRGVTGSARLTSAGQWAKWNAPCYSVGSSFAAPVATSATTLFDVCTIGGFGGNVLPGTPRYLKLESNWIFTSHDGGVTFVPTSQVVIGGSSTWLDPLPSLPVSPTNGSILVAKSVNRGTSVSDHFYLTRNGGRTWSSVYASPPTSFSPAIQFVAFASSSLGYAIVQRTATTSVLIISKNGGRTWHASVT